MTDELQQMVGVELVDTRSAIVEDRMAVYEVADIEEVSNAAGNLTRLRLELIENGSHSNDERTHTPDELREMLAEEDYEIRQ